MGNRIPKLWAPWLAAALVAGCVVCARPAHADLTDGVGGLGTHHFVSIGGYYETGERHNLEGSVFSFQMRGAALYRQTWSGGLAGLEGGMDLGFGEYLAPGTEGDNSEDLGFHFDMWMGFPFTVFQWGGGGPGSFRLGASPGFGWNLLHAYAYAKGRIAFVLDPDALDLDLSVQWSPMSTSFYTDLEGLNMLTWRGSLFYTVGDDNALELFFELNEADHETYVGKSGAPGPYDTEDPFLKTVTVPFQSVMRFGLGYVW